MMLIYLHHDDNKCIKGSRAPPWDNDDDGMGVFSVLLPLKPRPHTDIGHNVSATCGLGRATAVEEQHRC